MKQVTVILEDSQIDRLDTFAAKLGVSRSRVLRWVLEGGFRRIKNEVPDMGRYKSKIAPPRRLPR